MTRFAGVLLVLLAAALPACDSTDPLTGQSTQVVELRFIVQADSIFEADLWDRYIDSNNNGQVDPGEEQSGFACGDFYTSTFGTTQAPWPFSVDIRVVRNGTVVEDVLTSPNAASGYISATLEETDVILGQTPAQPPSPEPGFAYDNPRRVPDTSYDYLQACLIDVALPTFGQVGGLPIPVEISMQKGDTLIVTAGQSPVGITDYGAMQPLQANVLVNGLQLLPEDLNGPSTVVIATGTFRFSYQFE